MFVLEWIARILIVPIFAIAVAVLVKGYAETGGGFPAGMIAGLGVWLAIVGLGREAADRLLPWTRHADRLVVGGLLLMAAVSFFPLLEGKPAVSHLPRPSAPVIHFGSVELHTAILFEIGMALVTLGFVAGVALLLKTEDES